MKGERRKGFKTKNGKYDRQRADCHKYVVRIRIKTLINPAPVCAYTV